MEDKEEFAVRVGFNQKQSAQVISFKLIYMARPETNVGGKKMTAR